MSESSKSSSIGWSLFLAAVVGSWIAGAVWSIFIVIAAFKGGVLPIPFFRVESPGGFWPGFVAFLILFPTFLELVLQWVGSSILDFIFPVKPRGKKAREFDNLPTEEERLLLKQAQRDQNAEARRAAGKPEYTRKYDAQQKQNIFSENSGVAPLFAYTPPGEPEEFTVPVNTYVDIKVWASRGLANYNTSFTLDPNFRNIPFGVELNRVTGMLKGVPLNPGKYEFTVVAKNNYGEGSADVVLNVTE